MGQLKTFLLLLQGYSDIDEEGVWRWNSDGSLVTWTLWANWKSYGLEPNGGDKEDCGMMIKNYYKHDLLTSSASWTDTFCRNKHISTKNLVCQKAEGMYNLDVKIHTRISGMNHGPVNNRLVTMINTSKAPEICQNLFVKLAK